jgi:hypothetical protein
MYAEVGSIEVDRQVFDEMVTWDFVYAFLCFSMFMLGLGSGPGCGFNFLLQWL